MKIKMPISFGPGGNSESFINRKKKFPQDLPEYLDKLNLNGYEFECGRGVKISAKTYELLPEIAKRHKIHFSLHAPYFISLSSEDETIRLKSVEYIYEAAVAAQKLGIQKIVVHSGSCAKISRKTALELACDTLKKAQTRLDGEGFGEIIICPETMGKINQLGTLDEVIELCKVSEKFLPCIDFGHLNARTHGEIKTIYDYEEIFTKLVKELGIDKTRNVHIHFSRIMYTAGGEKTHLTFADREYGPDFEPLIEIISRMKLEPSIICESQGTQAEDASAMKEYYNHFNNLKKLKNFEFFYPEKI